MWKLIVWWQIQCLLWPILLWPLSSRFTVPLVQPMSLQWFSPTQQWYPWSKSYTKSYTILLSALVRRLACFLLNCSCKTMLLYYANNFVYMVYEVSHPRGLCFVLHTQRDSIISNFHHYHIILLYVFILSLSISWMYCSYVDVVRIS